MREPQEIDDDEIDILLKAQQDAEEAGRGHEMVPGLGRADADKMSGDDRRGGSGGWNKRSGGDSHAAGAPATPGINDNVWHRIHRNIFTHREPKRVTEDDVLICSCVPDPATGVGCGEDCINRDVLVECDPAFCPCGSGCQNQKFQNKKYAKLDIARTGRKGHGLFAKEAIAKKQFIIEYVGEVLHEDEYRKRKQTYEDNSKRHYYFMTLSSSETIDAAERGNAGRFLNHSCEPNCETQKWMVNGELCIGIFALRRAQRRGAHLRLQLRAVRGQPDQVLLRHEQVRRVDRRGEDGRRREGGRDGVGRRRRRRPVRRARTGDARGGRAADRGGGTGGEGGEEPGQDARQEGQRGRFRRGRRRVAALGAAAQGRVRQRRRRRRRRRRNRQGAQRAGEGTRRLERAENRVAGSGAGGGGMRRSGSSSGSGLHRKSGSRGSNLGGLSRDSSFPSYYGAPSTAKRRSEVDVRMEELRGSSGALRNAKAAVKCVHMFNLAYPVTAGGTQSVSQRDLGLLLEAVALTTNPATQTVLVEKGLFQALQMCVQRLGGAAAKSEHVPILRKVVKIVLGLMENAPSLVVKKLRDTRTARGTLAAALADLRRSADAGLREVAQRVAARLPPEAIEEGSFFDKNATRAQHQHPGGEFGPGAPGATTRDPSTTPSGPGLGAPPGASPGAVSARLNGSKRPPG